MQGKERHTGQGRSCSRAVSFSPPWNIARRHFSCNSFFSIYAVTKSEEINHLTFLSSFFAVQGKRAERRITRACRWYRTVKNEQVDRTCIHTSTFCVLCKRTAWFSSSYIKQNKRREKKTKADRLLHVTNKSARDARTHGFCREGENERERESEEKDSSSSERRGIGQI